ncbi:hypothetical protein NAEGRDRAFT_80682 [Naegleria gruberi]|uniref:Uncharacterized protein n=1 Tax=Naegleria gruberi TaxID=5762 RepID=D2VNW3_NAEGR|nr:uncharacterized protein NAEGRDRAFT_80682 [Naegleria gruberi]EFC41561.1 hypothetical protein NAEGRDRAFT_80682 [Naegleria gruberi]|eukprot:XP_002674305.1 hypothetical protein NAEGRDRAFT_80682 [Naegleria gruberi strain NEG-M]
MFLKAMVVCSSNRKEDQEEEDELDQGEEQQQQSHVDKSSSSSTGTHSHSNSNDSSIITIDLKQSLVVVDDVSDSNAKMIANQSETIRKSVRTLSNSLQYQKVEDQPEDNVTISKNSKIENAIISSRFDLIDNASDVSMTGDTFKLIASDIVRLIPKMKVDGIELVESSSPSNYEIEEAILRLFGQLFQNLGLVECCRADLFNTNSQDEGEELSVETIKNDMISTMENVWKELELKPHRLNTFKNILKILSCMQQESISQSVMDVKSKFKSEFGGKVRLFDGRMWVVELYFNNSSIEVVHYRTEKLCSSGSKIGQEISSTSTPRVSSGIEEVCKFVWSTTFTFQLIDDELELDARPIVDFQSIESMNDNLLIVKSFLSEIGATIEEELSREKCEELLKDHFQQFFKFN